MVLSYKERQIWQRIQTENSLITRSVLLYYRSKVIPFLLNIRRFAELTFLTQIDSVINIFSSFFYRRVAESKLNLRDGKYSRYRHRSNNAFINKEYERSSLVPRL